MTRPNTEKLLAMIEEGILEPTSVVKMCVKYMSEDDVTDMMDCNELSERFTETYEYWTQHRTVCANGINFSKDFCEMFPITED